MNIKYIKCKTGLSKSNLPGLDYSLNPYVGCQHNCAYCYAPNILRINRKEWNKIIGVKSNIPNILSKELKKKKNGKIGISTITDPYQPIEKKFKLTRYCLEQIIKYDFPIHFQTKSNIINRDIDLITKLSDVEIMISIGTFNDTERKILEPYSSSIQDRLETLSVFSEMGIKTSIFFGPIYPTINEKKLINILEKILDLNVKEIMIDTLHLKTGIWKNIQSELTKKPEMQKKFQKEKFIDKNLLSKIYNILIEHTKNKNIKISKAFN